MTEIHNYGRRILSIINLFLPFIVLFYKIATEAVENIRTLVSLTREKAFEQKYEETLQTQHR